MVLAIGNLASAHHSRYQRLNEIDDINAAVYLHQPVLALLSEDHPSRVSALNNLGNALMSRFEEVGEQTDLDHYRDAALTICGPTNPDRPRALISIGHGLFRSFSSTSSESVAELDE
jgi:hypothetical protein